VGQVCLYEGLVDVQQDTIDTRPRCARTPTHAQARTRAACRLDSAPTPPACTPPRALRPALRACRCPRPAGPLLACRPRPPRPVGLGAW
jgi:hypothetical protein